MRGHQSNRQKRLERGAYVSSKPIACSTTDYDEAPSVFNVARYRPFDAGTESREMNIIEYNNPIVLKGAHP
jgi:hypothetical protein